MVVRASVNFNNPSLLIRRARYWTQSAYVLPTPSLSESFLELQISRSHKGYDPQKDQANHSGANKPQVLANSPTLEVLSSRVDNGYNHLILQNLANDLRRL